MNLKISKIFLFSLVFSLVTNWAMVQAQSAVPELVEVQVAKTRLSVEIQNIETEIKNIQKLGGIVGIDLRNKEILFKAVKSELDNSNIGMSTYLAISNQSNYLGQKPDHAAFIDLNAGRWDVNMNAIIQLLKK